jgi:hypothetical protein
MSRNPDHTDDKTAAAGRRDAARRPGADRPPTAEEATAAERAAADLADELPEVAEHYEEMTRIGAEVKGEGEIPG